MLRTGNKHAIPEASDRRPTLYTARTPANGIGYYYYYYY